jgi:hypothetical protein
MTDDGLQFDRAELAGASGAGVTCVACKQPIVDRYFSARGQTLCGRCRDRLAQQLAAPPNLPRGVLFGVGGALAGAVIYFAVAAITNMEIGLVAVAVGWLVGRAMQIGTASAGSQLLQAIAAGLTYLSVCAAYLAVRVEVAVKAFGVAPGAAVSAVTGGSPLKTLLIPITENLAEMPMGAIGLLIVGVGVYQAWRMLAPVHLVFEGPFDVGPRPLAP